MIRTLYGTTNWFRIERAQLDCLVSPYLFNLYTGHITRNAGLDELQNKIKTAGRNINNLRYADDTTLMEESEEELKSLLMRVEEESEKAGLKLSIIELRSWHPVLSLLAIRSRKGGNSEISSSWALKSLRMVTADMKSEEDCLLAGKL